MKKNIVKTLSILSIIFMTSCQSQNANRICTQIGCTNNLTVQLKGNVASTFKLVVKSNGQEVASKDCNENIQCGSVVMFNDYNTANKNIAVEYTPTGGTTKTQNFTVDFKESRPNGEGCPPVCIAGTVDLPVN